MRRIFSKEFKQDAISLVLNQGYSCAEAARSLDIRYNVLTRWIREYKDDAGNAFRGKGNLRNEKSIEWTRLSYWPKKDQTSKTSNERG